MTPVVLEGVPHKMRNEPQDSLRATPRRLPVEGKPSECEQEVADNVMMAGCTNGIAGMAKPIITDINRTATLGKDLATVACGVDEGNEMECNELRLQQTNLFCKKVDQCNRNATEDVPSIHGVPLEGEWTVCASGEASNPKVDGIESEGCKGGTDEPMELLTMSVEPDVEDGGDIPRVNLGNQADGSRDQMDTLSMSNRAVTTGLSHSDGARTYLATRDTKRGVMETDGTGIHVDALSGRGDTLSVETNTSTTANEMQSVSIPRKKAKPPDSPVDTARTTPVEPNGFGDHADGSDAWMDVQSVGYKRETAENEMERVSTRQVDAQTQNSLHTTEVGMPEPTIQWRKVSGNNIDVYVPWNAPVEALGQTFTCVQMARKHWRGDCANY